MFSIAPIGYRLGVITGSLPIDIDVSYINDILPAITEALSGVDLGKINDRPRNSKFIQTHVDMFCDDENKFRGVFVDRVAAPSSGAVGNQIFRNHQIELTLYQAVNDENDSANLFQTDLDTALGVFDSMVVIATNVYQIATPQLLSKAEDMFGGILSHIGKIQITIQEEVTP